MRIWVRLHSATALLFTVLCACGSTKDTAVPVDAFSSSGCKLRGVDATLGDARCVSWAVQSDGSVAVDLSDFAELCGLPTIPWTAKARQDSPEKISISIEWGFETPNTCGACTQDFSLKLIGIQPEPVKTLEISTRGCSGECAWTRYEVDVSPSGAGADNKLCGESVKQI
jgi:hypothetical protein